MYFFVSISKACPNIVLLTPNKHIMKIYLVTNLMIFILNHNYLYFYIHSWISLLYCTKIRDCGRIVVVVFLPHVTSNGPGVQLSRAEAACMPVPKSGNLGLRSGKVSTEQGEWDTDHCLCTTRLPLLIPRPDWLVKTAALRANKDGVDTFQHKKME